MRERDKYKFSIIGGDMRSIMLCKILENKGYDVHTFALDSTGNTLRRCFNLYEAVSLSDVLIFPIPFSVENGLYLNAPFHTGKIEISSIVKTLIDLNYKGIIAGGKVPQSIKGNSFCVVDLLERDDLAILNSVPTAEGALQIAMEELPYTIRGSKALVCGMGRVGSTLARLLKNVGADVTVAVRKSKDSAICEAEGLHHTNYDDLPNILPNMRLIYNTVPALIFNSDLLDYVSSDSILIDLASMPGGVDFTYAKAKQLRVIHALSLPGKVAPEDAAEIIQKVIFNILNERNYKRS